MTTQETQERMEAVMAAADAKDLDGLFALVAEDAEFFDCGGETVRGKAALREMAAGMFSGIPDNKIVRTISLAVGEGTAIGEFETAGTHRGDYLGFPATDKPVGWTFVSVYAFGDDGLLRRQGYYYDTAGLAAQLS